MKFPACFRNIFILWLGSYATVASGQYPFCKNFTINDGLISNKVYHIMEDHYGFIWISTNLGVSRYDGVEFVNFTSKNGLPSNEILSTFEDRTGRIWFLSFNTEPSYYYEGKIYNAGNDSMLMRIRNKKPEGMCMSVIVQRNGSMAFLIENGIQRKLLVGKDIEDIPILEPEHSVYHIRGYLFQNILYQDGEDYYLAYSNEVVHWKRGAEVHLVDERIWGMRFNCTTNPGRLIYGLIEKDGATNLIELDVLGHKKKSRPFSSEYKETFMNGQWVVFFGDSCYIIYDSSFRRVIESSKMPFKFEGVYVDRLGNKWMCTSDEGIYFIRKPAPVSIKLKNSKNRGITDIKEWDGKLLLSTEHSGIVSVDSTGNCVNLFNHANLYRVRGYASVGKHILLGSDRGLFLLDEHFRFEKQLNNYATKDVERGFGDQAIIATAGRTLIYEHDSLSWIMPGRSTSVCAVDDKTIWVGRQKGIYKAVRSADSWVCNKLTLHPLIDQGSIVDIKRDKFGNMWVAMEQKGVFFCPIDGHVKMFCESQEARPGLISDDCQQIYIAPDSSIWLATVAGVSVIRYSYAGSQPVFKLQNYSIAEGMPGKIINSIVYYHGKVAMATPEGLYLLKEFPTPSGNTSETVITSVTAGSQTLDWRNITLPHNRNNLIISYASSFINTTMSYLFRYRVKELDPHWIETQTLQVPLLGLEPGQYTFEIASVNAQGNTGKITTLYITIRTPWYRQWWFLSLVALIFIASVLYYARLEKAKITLGKNLTLMRLRMLRAQMNPHFVFNALTNIQRLIQVKELEDANDYIGTLASIMRKSIEYSDKEFIQLDKEIEYTHSYLEIEKLRFGDKFDYMITFGNDAEELGSTFVPPLLLQPLVENAIKHGFRGISYKGHINIHIEKRGNRAIRYTINDNGRGFDNREGSGKEYGLGIARERVELLYRNMEKKGFIGIRSSTKDRKGTSIVIDLPILRD